MLDLNHRSSSERLNAVIDAGIVKAARREAPRSYVGASIIGKSCSRAIQFDYYHAEPDSDKTISGQTFRVFAVGHALEDLAIKWFRSAGFDLRTAKPDGSQFGFSTAGGRFAGHIDGVLCGGPPMTISFPALWECKTMNDKKFKEAIKTNLKSHPQYLAQVAIYQAYLDLTENPAILTAINKDNQDLHHFDIPFNQQIAQETSDKAARILQACDAGELLTRPYQSQDFYECKWCSFTQRCWSLPA